MHFTTALVSLLASAASVSAASVTFWALDDITRTVYFTGNPGTPDMEPVIVPGGTNKTVQFSEQYIGNFYAVEDGKENLPGMLGEVSFSSWGGETFFDVSAIVNPADHNNVRQMWPLNVDTVFSGCNPFPCNHAYYHPDDVQTQATSETELMCTLGSGHTGLSFLDILD